MSVNLYNFSDYNENGEIVDYEIDGKIFKCFRYVPPDVNPSTPVYVYYKGSGWVTTDSQPIVDYLYANESDSIVLIPIASASTGWVGKSAGETSVYMQEIIDREIEENGLINPNLVTSGFSAGGPAAVDLAIQYKMNNPSDENLIVNLMDPYNLKNLNVTEEKEEALENIWFLCYNFNSESGKEIMKNTPGVNLILISNRSEFSGGNDNHTNANACPYKDGLIDFSTGFGDLNPASGEYKFQIYDREAGDWVEITYDEVKALVPEIVLEEENFMQQSIRKGKRSLLRLKTIKCDNEFVQDNVNNIRGKIKSMGCLKTKALSYFGSTTSMPNVIVDRAHEIELTLINKLEILAQSFYNLAEASGEVEEMDKNLSSIAGSIGSTGSSGGGWHILSGGGSSSGITPDPTIPGPQDEEKKPDIEPEKDPDSGKEPDEDEENKNPDETPNEDENKEPDTKPDENENKEPDTKPNEDENKTPDETQKDDNKKPSGNNNSSSSGNKKPSSKPSKTPSKKPSSGNSSSKEEEKPSIVEIPDTPIEPEEEVPIEPEPEIPIEPEPEPEIPTIPEPEIPVIKEEPVVEEKTASPLKTIGILAGAGAAVGVGAYATHKAIEKKKNQEDRDTMYSDYEYADDSNEVAEEETNNEQMTPFDEVS